MTGCGLRNAAAVEKQITFKIYISLNLFEELCSHESEHYKKSKNGVAMLIINYITQSDWFIIWSGDVNTESWLAGFAYGMFGLF